MTHPYLRLMRFDKPIGIFLLLWPTLWALWLANQGPPSIVVLMVFVVGTVLMRAAGCVINDIADRNYDGHVQRTAARPLITGEVSLTEAVGVFWGLLLMSGTLLFFLNGPSFIVAVVAACLAVVYPFAKRILPTPQLILGFAFSSAIPLAYIASGQPLTWLTGLLCLVNCLWVIAYDTYYAMVDRDDDLTLGIKSTAILFGKYDRAIIALMQSLMAFGWCLIAVYAHLDIGFVLFGVFAHGLFVYQYWLTSDKSRQHCFQAFLNNNWYGLLMWVGLVINYW